MWIFRWAFRFPTCAQAGGQRASPSLPGTSGEGSGGRGPCGGIHPSSSPDLPSRFLPSLPYGPPPRPHLVELLVAVRALVLLVGVVRLQVAHL